MVERVGSDRAASVGVFSLRAVSQSYLRDTPRRGLRSGRCRAGSRGSRTAAPRGENSSTRDGARTPARHYGAGTSASSPLSARGTQRGGDAELRQRLEQNGLVSGLRRLRHALEGLHGLFRVGEGGGGRERGICCGWRCSSGGRGTGSGACWAASRAGDTRGTARRCGASSICGRGRLETYALARR